jgi:hypothetical protein
LHAKKHDFLETGLDFHIYPDGLLSKYSFEDHSEKYEISIIEDTRIKMS